MKKFLKSSIPWRVSDLIFFGSMFLYLLVILIFCQHSKNANAVVIPYILFLTVAAVFKNFNFGKVSKFINSDVLVKNFITAGYILICIIGILGILIFKLI
jgi:hypothetical protein